MPSPLEIMTERRAAKKAELETLLELPTAETRDLSNDESDKFTLLMTEIRAQDDRIKELTEQDAREAAAAETRKIAGDVDKPAGGAKVTDPPVYVRDEKNGNSWFRDFGKSRNFGDMEATQRLVRSSRANADEQRALGNTGAVGGSGGEFAPPQWLVEDYISLLRAGRVTANLFQHMDIPDGVSSINLPKVATGTTTAVQTTQNTALSQTDMTTTYVQTGFATVGGKQVVSQQLLDQSAIPFDRVILQDLAADYALRIGSQIYLGTGTGSGTGAVINGLGAATAGSTQTWTQASPTIAGFYGQCASLLSKFIAARYAPPTHWLMSPRRWYWLVGASDTSSRPLVVPQGTAFNPIATLEGTPVQGIAGIFLGLPVVIDPNAPINLGGGTNQDNVYLIKADDLWLAESAPRAETFTETYADSVGVLFRMYGYVGTILNRYTASIGVLSGTGLVTPTFAS